MDNGRTASGMSTLQLNAYLNVYSKKLCMFSHDYVVLYEGSWDTHSGTELPPSMQTQTVYSLGEKVFVRLQRSQKTAIYVVELHV